jgi:hypothetical protein
MIAPPIVVSPAFEDRDAIWRMIQTHSPYPLMAALAGYGELMGEDVSPWFRSNWALDGQASRPPRGVCFHRPNRDFTRR